MLPTFKATPNDALFFLLDFVGIMAFHGSSHLAINLTNINLFQQWWKWSEHIDSDRQTNEWVDG